MRPDLNQFLLLSSDTKASSSFNNNNVNGSNSKSGPALYPTLTDANEHISFDESRKTEAGASRFTPIEAPVVRDYSYSAEKRKWSQVNAHKLLNQLASGGDSSSSDDEVKELCCVKKPVSMAALSSSPPGKVTILSKHSAFTSRSRAVKPVEGHARKKHRVVFAAECDGERPSLDFDKMQVGGDVQSWGQAWTCAFLFEQCSFSKGHIFFPKVNNGYARLSTGKFVAFYSLQSSASGCYIFRNAICFFFTVSKVYTPRVFIIIGELVLTGGVIKFHIIIS